MTPPSVPVLSAEEAAAWEKHVWGEAPDVLETIMQQVGAVVAAEANLRAPGDDRSYLILVGKGHNGADALQTAAAFLQGMGKVTLMLAEGETALKPLTQKALQQVRASAETHGADGVSSLEIIAADALDTLENRRFTVIVDGLLGFGLRSALREPYSRLIAWANAPARRADLRVSIDLPSGLGGEGPVFRADYTFATGAIKDALLHPSAPATAGRIRLIDLGLFAEGEPEEVAEPRRWLTADTLEPLRQLRPAASHKRDYGHVFAIAGSNTMPGAALMATQAALLAGVGLATVALPGSLGARLAGQLPEAMLAPYNPTPTGGLPGEFPKVMRLASTRATAMLLGPGLVLDRSSVFAVCRVIRESALPLVLDASALLQDAMSAVMGRPRNAGPVVITPHVGEFARLLGTDPRPELVDEAPAFARRHQCVVLLKGPVTTVTDGTQTVCYAAGGPVLARGGSGDILAGMIAARLALAGADPFTATCEALVWQGVAADLWARERGEVAVSATGVLDYLGAALVAS